MITFGPIPSRRLKRSLGINNLVPKYCTYACIYCQAGQTSPGTTTPVKFYSPERIQREVEEGIRTVEGAGETINYLTFVADGEPTLDMNLGRSIRLLKPFRIPVAVITNGSLLWRPGVRESLQSADWVSIKVDAVTEETWRSINRPHESLNLAKILNGIEDFSSGYNGEMTTETMLVQGINDSLRSIKVIAEFIENLDPDKAYLAAPTRPPAEPWVKPPDYNSLNRAYQVMTEHHLDVEYLIGYEGTDFFPLGSAEASLLSIAAVHPLRRDALEEYVSKTAIGWDAVENLLRNGRIKEVSYGDHTFYLRGGPNVWNNDLYSGSE